MASLANVLPDRQRVEDNLQFNKNHFLDTEQLCPITQDTFEELISKCIYNDSPYFLALAEDTSETLGFYDGLHLFHWFRNNHTLPETNLSLRKVSFFELSSSGESYHQILTIKSSSIRALKELNRSHLHRKIKHLFKKLIVLRDHEPTLEELILQVHAIAYKIFPKLSTCLLFQDYSCLDIKRYEGLWKLLKLVDNGHLLRSYHTSIQGLTSPYAPTPPSENRRRHQKSVEAVTEHYYSHRKSEESVQIFKAQDGLPFNIPTSLSISTLVLSNCSLEAFPREVFELKELRVLNLSENKLNILPRSSCLGEKLKTVDLTNNKLFDTKNTLRFCKKMLNVFLGGNPVLLSLVQIEQDLSQEVVIERPRQ